MKAVLLILLILAGGAGIYFSIEQQKTLENTITENNTLEEENKVRSGDLRTAQGNREEADRLRNTWITTRSEKSTLVDDKTRENQSLTDDLATKTTQLAAKEKEYQAIQDQLAKFNFSDPQEVVDRKDAAEAKNKELLAANEEMNTVVEGVAKKVGDLQAELGALQTRQAEYRQKLASNGKEFRVMAVDPQWGFVVVNAGENDQLTPQTVLMVSRDGKSIAKLKITSLEKNQTVADVIEGSLGKGNRINIGDHVILATPQG